MEQAIMWIMAVGAVVGGIDRMLGNKFGLGKQFEDGFLLMGNTALSIAGVLCLVPLISIALESVIAPMCIKLGFDPAIFGSILAIDMGGYQLSVNMARNPLVGKYSGILVGAILGCTISFSIPVGMGMLQEKDRPDYARGILFGLIAMPPVLVLGGVMCGLSVIETAWNSLPILVLWALLLLGIWKKTEAMVRGFTVFAKGIEILTTIGLVLGVVTYMTGVKIIPNLAPIEEAMSVVASIAIVQLGSLPMVELLQRALKKPLKWFGEKTGMDSVSAAGLLVSTVSAISVFLMMKNMNRRGRVANAAFIVCATGALAAHLGFTAGVDSAMIVPMLVTKLLGGVLGATIALLATKENA